LEERQMTGATEYDTGLDMPDLDFRASYSTVEASPELAVVFGVPEGTALLRRDYWTSSRAENSPLNIVRSYLVRDVAARNPELLDEDKEPWPGGTMSQLYTLGIEIDRIVDEITARPPTPDEADLLEIEPGVSVLVLRKTSIDTTGKVAEYSEVILPGDRAEIAHTTTLERW
jgi:GntR family transcriptional regulator